MTRRRDRDPEGVNTLVETPWWKGYQSQFMALKTKKYNEQIEAAKAAAAGNTYLAQRVRRTKTDGGTVNQTVQRRVRQWFRAVDDKRWAVMLFYGSKQLEFGKGKNAVEVASLASVAATLDTLRKAVLAGELDSQITTAADALKRGFKQ